VTARALAAALLLAGCTAQATANATGPRGHGPVVVELFQSQGCSSCPPANANLATIVDQPDVLALNFSITYWDDQGWKDTFAKPAYTQRQHDYAQALHQGPVYTPEMVIDGRKPGVGAETAEFGALVAWGRQTGLPGPAVTFASGHASIAAGAAPPRPADVWLVRYDPRELQVPVSGGENAGKTLPHRDIVRDLSRLGAWTGAAASFPVTPPADPAWRTAILVQSPNGGPILAAAKG
jgi:hypothetical protein